MYPGSQDEGVLPKRLVILDRDGVINEDSDAYIKSPDEWQPIPGSLEAVAKLNRAGAKVIVFTNQSGVARGLFDLTTLAAINCKMEAALAAFGGRLHGIYFCPHGPDDGCECRKPRPGMLHQIAHDFRTSLTDVPVVGDSLRDLEAAVAVGARPILVRSGKGERTLAKPLPEGATVYADLAAVADALIAQWKGEHETVD